MRLRIAQRQAYSLLAMAALRCGHYIFALGFFLIPFLFLA